jgi:hypothetical protein
MPDLADPSLGQGTIAFAYFAVACRYGADNCQGGIRLFVQVPRRGPLGIPALENPLPPIEKPSLEIRRSAVPKLKLDLL